MYLSSICLEAGRAKSVVFHNELLYFDLKTTSLRTFRECSDLSPEIIDTAQLGLKLSDFTGAYLCCTSSLFRGSVWKHFLVCPVISFDSRRIPYYCRPELPCYSSNPPPYFFSTILIARLDPFQKDLFLR